MNNGAKLPSAARGCGRGRRRQLRPVPGRGRPGRARGLGRAAPHTCSRGAQAGTPPAEEGESRSALPNAATSPGVLWHRTRRESARELPSRRGLFLTCSPFHSSLSGLRARLPPPPPQQRRTRAPHLAQRLRTPSASPGPRPPPLRGHSAAESQPGKDRLAAACLSAKYWNRLGWGRGARRASPLASLRARLGGEAARLSLRRYGAAGPGRRAPSEFRPYLLNAHPSSVIEEAGASNPRTLGQRQRQVVRRLPHLQPPP